jgi:DNA-binding transcriptional LysR family regulator
MTLNQLRYFLALCEAKSFTLAARSCAVSQPSLTNAIRTLEHELGGTLFYRKPQIELTTLGQALQPHFRSIIGEVERTTLIVASTTKQTVSTIADITISRDFLTNYSSTEHERPRETR